MPSGLNDMLYTLSECPVWMSICVTDIRICRGKFNDGFKRNGLLTVEEAMYCLLKQLDADQSQPPERWAKPERNAEILRRYLAGENSVVLGRAFGLGDRRIRNIIAHERRRYSS